MRWPPRGAHHVVVVRAAVLDERLSPTPLRASRPPLFFNSRDSRKGPSFALTADLQAHGCVEKRLVLPSASTNTTLDLRVVCLCERRHYTNQRINWSNWPCRKISDCFCRIDIHSNFFHLFLHTASSAILRPAENQMIRGRAKLALCPCHVDYRGNCDDACAERAS